ncbi:MAG: cell envelope integrity protein TolA [Alphaproteobacteria bacterium]|nr:cell envelope integrity protein TolA [Alphaproteobacteria bacterium]MCB9792600.1 cell envelope integrity protein TolA [Alphaproteobacteria bacterium]
MQSTLRGEPYRPGAALPMSLGLHAMVFVALYLSQAFARPAAPLINPDEVMEVSLLAMPKQTTAMPQKASRTPDPVTGSAEPTPEAPPPTDSELVQHTPEAPKEKGDPEADRKKQRDELMEKMRREQARKDALAALGSQDRAQTDPDGIEGATGTSSGTVGDPKLAAYLERVKQVILPNWSFLKKDKGLTVVIAVTINRSGDILEWRVRTSSGDPSFDNTAKMAVSKTGQVPAPPAEYMPDDTASFSIRFSEEDKP